MGAAVWNELELKQPPTFTCKLTSKDVSFSDLRKLSDVCWNALTTLQNQETLYTEAATLSRLIYRMKSMFRGDKGFKCIEKINHSLRHVLSLNLPPMYDNLFRTIPWDCSDKEIYCPTRQMLQYVLLRTQGLAALLCRIVHTCLEAASFFKSRMSSGHNWQVSLLCLGAVSRIWALTKHILHSCVEWYSGMLPFINIFQMSGPTWLPEGYIFPKDLRTWLSMPWMDTQPEISCESEINITAESKENSSNSIKPEGGSHSTSRRVPSNLHAMLDDVGVSVSRQSIQRISAAPENIVSTGDLEEVGRPAFSEEDALKANPVDEIKLNKKISKNSRKKLNRLKTIQGNSCSEVQVVSPQDQKLESSNAEIKRAKKNLDDRGSSSVPEISQNIPKNGNALKIISSLKSQCDVQRLLKNESKKRSITSHLRDEQWELLKGVLGKLNTKLKKTENQKKKTQILDQIKKAFKISLC